nr:hypothetical protein [Tanacetum cinerariifolium]
RHEALDELRAAFRQQGFYLRVGQLFAQHLGRQPPLTALAEAGAAESRFAAQDVAGFAGRATKPPARCGRFSLPAPFRAPGLLALPKIGRKAVHSAQSGAQAGLGVVFGRLGHLAFQARLVRAAFTLGEARQHRAYHVVIVVASGRFFAGRGGGLGRGLLGRVAIHHAPAGTENLPPAHAEQEPGRLGQHGRVAHLAVGVKRGNEAAHDDVVHAAFHAAAGAAAARRNNGVVVRYLVIIEYLGRLRNLLRQQRRGQVRVPDAPQNTRYFGVHVVGQKRGIDARIAH